MTRPLKEILAFCLALLLASAPALAASAVQPTPDVKVFAFIAKRADLTDEQFHAHWREPHGRLAKQVPQIRRYHQNHGIGAVPALPGLAPTPYLGIATIWVADLVKLGAIYGDPGYVEIHADELNLLDRNQLVWLVTREWVVAPGPRADDPGFMPIKAQLLLKRRADVPLAEFEAAIGRVAGGARRQTAAIGVSYALALAEAYPGADRPPFDAVIELSYQDAARFGKAWRRAGPMLLERLSRVAELEASRGFFAREERVIWPWR